MTFGESLILLPVGVFVIYVVVRIGSAAYYQSKLDFEKRSKVKGDEHAGS